MPKLASAPVRSLPRDDSPVRRGVACCGPVAGRGALGCAGCGAATHLFHKLAQIPAVDETAPHALRKMRARGDGAQAGPGSPGNQD